jgi:NADPH-dependent curcumin reductase
MPPTNHQVRLAARPSGLPRSTDWELTSEPAPEPGPGQFTMQVSHLSIDPAMRGWMNAGASYVPPVEIGAVMRAGAVGRVTASEHPGFAVGDGVYGTFGVQEYAVSDGRGVIKIDTSLAGPATYLGALGMTGLTAYFGLLDTGRLKAGETVVVSGAAGAVGSVVGQIAKIKGCRAIGIAGGPEKCRVLVEEFGFDAAIDYRAGNVRKALREYAPGGIDVYFDNVGGEHLEAAIGSLNQYGRAALCGAISGYNATEPRPGPANLGLMVGKRLTLRGFIVSDHADLRPEFESLVGQAILDGKMEARESTVYGLENAVSAFIGMLTGMNIGKTVVQLAGLAG